MRYLMICILLAGCGLNPPQPPQPKGDRIPVNAPVGKEVGHERES